MSSNEWLTLLTLIQATDQELPGEITPDDDEE
jgi:hypothetical protein